MAQDRLETEKELSALIARFPVCITYVALPTEVAFRNIIPELPARTYEIAPSVALDPIQEALKARAVADDDETVVLIPGRAFDALGTRHGRGDGWYDRFLAHTPIEWTRIGFCFDDQFSEEALPLQPWDQVMDFVAVASRSSNRLILHTTHARS